MTSRSARSLLFGDSVHLPFATGRSMMIERNISPASGVSLGLAPTIVPCSSRKVADAVRAARKISPNRFASITGIDTVAVSPGGINMIREKPGVCEAGEASLPVSSS